jgi:uncharacterized membrane protein
MIVWGAFWGAVIGYVVVRYDEGFGAIVGALLGALAGRTLRNVVRKEVAAQLAAARASVLPGHLPAEPLVSPVTPVTTSAFTVTADAAVEAEAAQAADFASASVRPAGEPDPVGGVPPGQVPVTPVAEPVRVTYPATSTADTNPSEVLPALPATPDAFSRLFVLARNWLLGGNTIVRMGVLVLFVGLAFLAKYAVDNALLPPELRLASVAAAGIALFVFGWRLSGRQPDRLAYALTLQGAGVGVLYLTVFAAFRLYQFLPAGAAFAVLGLICAFSTAIALLQNAMPMAFIGFAGAFAAPLLVSTGQGNHVGLFSYYLLLGVAIAAVAWLRAWRALNLLGFFATFGVATLWGVLKYQPEQLGSTEPFLVAFFLLYLAASLMYATRHALHPKQAVDATLIFGLPLVAFGLQAALVRNIEYATAFSSLTMGALYLALGWWAMKRRDAGVGQWLGECFAALGLGFVTLAVPLALDARWTSAVWAAEGAGVYWMGQRQDRWLARLVGLALQVFAALSYLSALDHAPADVWPLANPSFIGAVLLAASALALAHWTRFAAAPAGSAWVRQFMQLEQSLSPALFWVGFLWWQFALLHDIERAVPNTDGNWVQILSPAMQSHLEMLGWLASAWLAHRLALPERARPWSIASTPAWFSLPVMLLFALQGVVELDHVFQDWGWLVWPLALWLHFVTLKHLDAMAPQRWWSWVHSGGVWLVMLLAGNLLVWAVQRAQLQGTAWASVIFLVASVLVLLALTPRPLYQADSRVRAAWPLVRFAQAYLWRAAWPLAVAVALGALVVAVHSDGNALPLPYVPVLNPTDLTVALALATCAMWLSRVRQSNLALPAVAQHARWPLVLAGLAFVAVNTVWLRVAHHFAGVPWAADRLFESFLVQAGYSILWTLMALGLMLLAHRRHTRQVWMGGAILLGLTVAKLFLVDLSNRGGSERIVAFIAVGVMMLVVGYFAPIPPAPAREAASSGESAA